MDDNITIKQADTSDIPVIEELLADAVERMQQMGESLWTHKQIKWSSLSRWFSPEDFFIAYENGEPAACLAMNDEDRLIWPDIPKGEALFLHKLAVKRGFSGKGYSIRMFGVAVKQAISRGIPIVRIDVDAKRDKLRKIYEDMGFEFIKEVTILGKYRTALYMIRCDKWKY